MFLRFLIRIALNEHESSTLAYLLSGGGLRGKILETKARGRHSGIQKMAYVLSKQNPWLDEQRWHRDGMYIFIKKCTVLKCLKNISATLKNTK